MEPNWIEADYITALEEVEMLMGAAPGTVEGERLDVLSMQIEAYERRRFPMDLLDSGSV
jgi:HTH-type transcriptional regulator/antitoxin HigA